jgi:hypothetical protein
MDWLLLSTPVLPLAWGYLLLREIHFARHLRKTGIKATGQIVSQRQEIGRYNSLRAVPLAKYLTKRGQLIEAESASSTIASKLPIGARVTLYYDAKQPNRFMFAQELTMVSRYVLLALAILLVVVVSLLVWS